MKRIYSAPSIVVVDCECQQMIAASNEQLQNGGVIPTSAPQRGGGWGDIWSN